MRHPLGPRKYCSTAIITARSASLPASVSEYVALWSRCNKVKQIVQLTGWRSKCSNYSETRRLGRFMVNIASYGAWSPMLSSLRRSMHLSIPYSRPSISWRASQDQYSARRRNQSASGTSSRRRNQQLQCRVTACITFFVMAPVELSLERWPLASMKSTASSLRPCRTARKRQLCHKVFLPAGKS